MVIIADMTQLTREVFASMQPVLQELENRQAHYFVVNGSSLGSLQQMQDATGLHFSFFNSDAEVLGKIVETNTGMVVVQDGRVVAVYDEANFPVAEEL